MQQGATEAQIQKITVSRQMYGSQAARG